MKNYFFRSEEIKGEIKVYPLANQTDETGNKINETLLVSCSKAVRSSSKAPDYFVGSNLTLSSTGKFYRCFGDFRRLDPTSEEAKEMDIVCGTSFARAKETFIDTLRKDKTLRAPTSKDDGFYMSDDDWNLLIRNIKRHVNTMIIGVTGCGKCLGKDTPILMYDGTIKPVQDVIVGDKLMGPDSKPRNVLSITTGREELFRITPVKGDSWVCNKSHILSLKRTNDGTSLAGTVKNVSISDYLSWSKGQKHIYKQWRTGVDFPENSVQLDPYFLGIWLGDGITTKPQICTADKEIVDYINEYASTLGCSVTITVEPSKANSYRIVQKELMGTRQHTEIIKRMNIYNLLGNKHIPKEFLYNSRENRLKLFAGLMDTDGHLHGNCFEYCTKLDNLKDEIVYLSRSLGYFVSCSKKEVKGNIYWRLFISGNFSDVPIKVEHKKPTERAQKKSVLVTGFSVESIGEGDYYGFTIDGDHLFMLGDFTVTHNTSCVKQACDKLGLPLYTFDMGSMIDPISSLLGVHRLEDGKSIFDYAKFTQVIQEPCVILLDELNRASLACNNVLFPCLDDRRKLSIEIACGKGIREIKVHPEVTFIATANIGSEYSGTQIMDKALVNRFFPLELGLIPSKEEEQVLIKRTGVDPKSSELIVKVANNIRSLSQKEEISSSLSIRETLMVANLVSDGWDLGKAMEMVYLPLYEGSSTEGERGTVYKTISTY